ncbi:MAG TPA: chitinase [Polyangiales bacterium]|nr:chitinase [Polyangiales bacterium]
MKTFSLLLCFVIGCASTSSAGPRAGAPTEPPLTAAVGHRVVAPYYYLGWGDPPNVQDVMQATGVRWFTLAFVIDGGSCEPSWDAERALDDARDVALIAAIRAHGGDVMVSFGGEKGPALELSCTTPSALAAAYKKVITTHKLEAIDIDIEGPAYADDLAKQRTVAALLEVRAQHPDVALFITLASSTSGPDTKLIDYAARAGLMVDGWSIMTFDWGDTSTQQAQLSMQALDHLKTALMTAYGFDEREAYRHAGISSMNGRTDEGAFVTVEDMRAVTTFAKQHQLARLTFWSVNRDRPCPDATTVVDRCSSIAQNNWDFTRAIADYLK